MTYLCTIFEKQKELKMKNVEELNEMLDNLFEVKRNYENAVCERLAGTKPMAILQDVEDEECNEPMTLRLEGEDDTDTYKVDIIKAEEGMMVCHVCEINGKMTDTWYPYYFFGVEGIYILSNIAWE